MFTLGNCLQQHIIKMLHNLLTKQRDLNSSSNLLAVVSSKILNIKETLCLAITSIIIETKLSTAKKAR